MTDPTMPPPDEPTATDPADPTPGDDATTATLTEDAAPPPPSLVGRVVDYETEDRVTGQTLTGTGIVVQQRAGADEETLLVAPLNVLGIELPVDAVTVR